MEAFMFDFKTKQFLMATTNSHLANYASNSNLIFDLRTVQQIDDSKHKNQTTSLNQALSVFSQRPPIIDTRLANLHFEHPRVFLL